MTFKREITLNEYMCIMLLILIISKIEFHNEECQHITHLLCKVWKVHPNMVMSSMAGVLDTNNTACLVMAWGCTHHKEVFHRTSPERS